MPLNDYHTCLCRLSQHPCSILAVFHLSFVSHGLLKTAHCFVLNARQPPAKFQGGRKDLIYLTEVYLTHNAFNADSSAALFN